MCVVAATFVTAAPSAFGSEHPALVGEYGKEGPKATGLGNGCRIGWHAATERLYLYSDSKVYGLERTGPGTVEPLAGGFPIDLSGLVSTCADRDLGVDNSGTGSDGNVYLVPGNTGTIYGYDSSGAPLPSPWPIDGGPGDTCGVAPDHEGNVWGGHYSEQELTRFSSAGSLLESHPFGSNICKLEVDQTNNDVIAQQYGGAQTLYRLKPPYTAKEEIVGDTNFSNAGLAVNGAENKVYVATGTPSIDAYDLDTGALIETITPPGGSAVDVDEVAVDEATDTVFLVVDPTTAQQYNDAYIAEYPGFVVPIPTTGEPIHNAEVSGIADPNGVGPITECYFEFGPTTSYGSKQECAEAVPFNSEQPVSAVLPGLTSEETYHYRLVLDTGVEYVSKKGEDKTITPHHVEGMKTEAAEDVTRTTATLTGSFEGNGEETHYYFEWGQTTEYGMASAAPPGVSAGSPTYPPLASLEFGATGLEPETVYHYRLVGENGNGITQGEDETFETLPAVQSLVTEGAETTPGFATLHASYVGDATATAYYFEYVYFGDYEPAAENPYAGGQVTAAFPGADAGSGSGPQELSAVAGNVKPHNEYHYRVVATNSLGTTHGADETFISSPPVLPDVNATFGSDVTQTEAKLNAQVNPGFGPTIVRFEYGRDTSYGSRTYPTESIGLDGADHAVDAQIDELTPGTTYHFRAVATNIAGTVKGPDQIFATARPPVVAPPVAPPIIPVVAPVSPAPKKLNCGRFGRKAAKAARAAKRLRSKAKRTSGHRASRRLRRQAKRKAKQARHLHNKAKRCRARNRSAR